MVPRNQFIDGDLSDRTSLIHLLDNNDSEDNNEAHIIKHSPYYSESCHVLVKPLTVIVNQSLHTGVYLSQFKLSRIKPLFKNGNKSQFNNYRPISLLPSLSKIFEYVMFDQLLY